MASRKPLPAWLAIAGWLLLPAFLVCIGRVVYEEAYLTWLQGPQMIGFSMVHMYPGLLLLGMSCVVLTHVWLLVFVIEVIWKRPKLTTPQWTLLVTTVVGLALLYVPHVAWEYVFVRPAEGGRASVLVDAASEGNMTVVKLLLDEGVDVNSAGSSGPTPIVAAGSHGQVEMVFYLLSKGAKVTPAEAFSVDTALLAQKKEDQRQVIGVLLGNGLSPCEKNQRGETATDVARRTGHREISLYLAKTYACH